MAVKMFAGASWVYLLGAAIGLTCALIPWANGDLTGIIVLVLSGIWLSHKVRLKDPLERARVRAMLLTAFILRSVLAIVVGFSPVLPDLYRLDADMYQRMAVEVARAWAHGRNPQIDTGSLGPTSHVYALAVASMLSANSALAMRAVVVIVGTLSIYRTYLCGRELVGPRRAMAIAWILAVWPSHIFWTSYPFRDAWVFYFLAAALQHGARWVRRGSHLDALKGAMSGIGAGLFRPQVGAILLVTFGVVGVWKTVRRAIKLKVPRGYLAALLMAVSGAVLVLWAADLNFGAFLEPEQISTLRTGLATGGSSIHPEMWFEDWMSIVKFVPVGVVYFLFAPFPWQASGLVQAMAALENTVFYILIGAAWLGWRPVIAGDRANGRDFVWIFLAISLVAYGVVEGNVGTGYRHKMQFVPWLLLLVAPPWRVRVRGHGQEYCDDESPATDVRGRSATHGGDSALPGLDGLSEGFCHRAHGAAG